MVQNRRKTTNIKALRKVSRNEKKEQKNNRQKSKKYRDGISKKNKAHSRQKDEVHVDYGSEVDRIPDDQLLVDDDDVYSSLAERNDQDNVPHAFIKSAVDGVTIFQKHSHKDKTKGNKRKRDCEGDNSSDTYAEKDINRRKRKDFPADFELIPRSFDDEITEKRVRKLLPIKDSSGVVAVSETIEDEKSGDETESVSDTEVKDNGALETNDTDEAERDVDTDVESHHLQSSNTEKQTSKSRSIVELIQRRKEKLVALKNNIARLANCIIGCPQENLLVLKDLIRLFNAPDPIIRNTQQKLVMISLTEIFKDIIPGYRIRPPQDDEEKKKMKKKETIHIQQYESNLLLHYKKYLMLLEIRAKKLKVNTKKGLVKTREKRDNVRQLSLLAVQCLCDLLATHSHFNFSKNIVTMLVPYMSVSDVEFDSQVVSNVTCACFEAVYKQDKLGDISLHIVTETVKNIKFRHYEISRKVLDTFLALKIDFVEPKKREEKQKIPNKIRGKLLSRKQRKYEKYASQLRSQLLEDDTDRITKKKTQFQSDITSQIFMCYFRILKSNISTPLLSSVLEGLAKFSHFINVEIFADLFSVLHKLMDGDRLDYRQRFHCVQTIMTVLSGQGETLTVDPVHFYAHAYKNILALHAGSSSEDVPMAVLCLNMILIKRWKKVSFQKVVAFAKRACTSSLQLRHNGVIAMLALLRSLFLQHKRADVLLETDVSQSCGVFIPEVEDPEYCNASSTALWELSYLKQHYHPVVKQFASHIAAGTPLVGGGSLPRHVSLRSPQQLFEDFNADGDFNPPPYEPVKQKPKLQKWDKTWEPSDNKIKRLVEQVLEKAKLEHKKLTMHTPSKHDDDVK